MVLLDNHEHHFMQADFQKDCIKTLPQESFDQSFEDATIFTIKGSQYGFVQISCKNQENNQELFWTWPENTKKSYKTTIRLKPKEPESKFQKFYFIEQFGNGIACFTPFGEDMNRETLWVTKHKDETYGKLALKDKDGRLGGNVNMPQRAPPRRSFLLFPKNGSTKFYFGMNHITNSIRYTNPEKQYIRHDERFSNFIKKPKKSKPKSKK